MTYTGTCGKPEVEPGIELDQALDSHSLLMLSFWQVWGGPRTVLTLASSPLQGWPRHPAGQAADPHSWSLSGSDFAE